MKKILSLILILTILVSFCACTPTEFHDSMQAMDTYMKFTIYGGQPESAMKSVTDEVRKLDRILSTTETGDIGLLNEHGENNISDETREALTRSLELCSELDGSLDITVYPLVEEWGFISGKYNIPSKKRIDELMNYVDYTKVKVDGKGASLPKSAKVDLGAVAKGFLADKCVEIARSEGSRSAIFDLGGTIAVYGRKHDNASWQVGIADPDSKKEYFSVIRCHDTVVATSGGYERCFVKNGKKYIHILDPKTGYPVDNEMKSVSVICEDGTRADALSTALYVMGVDKALKYYNDKKDFDFVILTNDNKLYVSSGIYDNFTLCEGYDFETVRID